MEKALIDASMKVTKTTKDLTTQHAEADSKLITVPEKVPQCADEVIIDHDMRELVRKDLLNLGQTIPSWKRRGIAPVLVTLFGEEIKDLRRNGHSWESIVKVIRKHGLHVSEEALKLYLN